MGQTISRWRVLAAFLLSTDMIYFDTDTTGVGELAQEAQ
jgi:uncharacterized protein YprB with RNaseH-like and TPR domain